MTPDQIVDYVRKNGRQFTRIKEGGDAENGPSYSSYNGTRVGSLFLVEEGEHISCLAINRRVQRLRTAFVLNEPVAAGAMVVVKDTFPQMPF